ncbi:eukaryotic translation initiation factor 3 subunit A-like isoform X2 [Amphibalanus amphitrite]|nr:eukaryotic translation initiation factor 3 subunit A-like isoform X2 [Amphibalanus amphitrite]XP_043194567.1 eukaryotic translation initiation factor 3 subunit A-like isoform X2 [Amphibalanus amphitrite]
MAPPAADGNVIRRSIYQNSNTMVEVLTKSKDPRSRTATAGSTAASEPAWPAAVPVRRDGRPLSATARQLPPRPRTGRPLPAWQSAGGDPTGGRPSAGRGGGQRPAPGRPPAARGQPPAQRQGQTTAGPGRPTAPNRPAVPPENEQAEHADSWKEFTVWTNQLKQLVRDIGKRPATAHLRPLLSRLEETVRVPPVPPGTLWATEDDEHGPLRDRLEEIQLENEDLQRKFQSLSAAMRDYQQQRQTIDGAGGDDRLRRTTETDTELAELKRQLAKYKKYAKELKKTKENLLNTIQTQEEKHAAELKSLKEEHETQMSQVLAQFTSETEMLVSFRADVEAVQRSLAQRVRENSELQKALAERDTELERLAAQNQTLHELALKLLQVPGSDPPSVTQLLTKLQSPDTGGVSVIPGGAGDSAPPARDASLFSLDVTEPLPARPFPREWADLSLGSLVGSAGTGEQRLPADGDRGAPARRPPSGAAGEPPRPASGAAAGSAPSGERREGQEVGGGDAPPQRQSREADTGGPTAGGDAPRHRQSREGSGVSQGRPAGGDTPPQHQPREAGAGDTNQRLFGGPVTSTNRDGPAQDRSGRGDQLPDGDGGPAAVDQCVVGPTGGGDCGRLPPVGSLTSEETFQRSLARLAERMTDLHQGISLAAQVLSP